jgi:Cation transport ATPase
VFDKTGTLTKGILQVTSCKWLSDAALDEEKIYLLLSIAEGREASIHPVANALFNWALKNLPSSLRNSHRSGSVTAYQRVPGQGLFCEVDMVAYGIQQIWVGNAKYFKSQSIQISHEDPSAVGISVWIAVNGSYVGKVILSV